MPLCYCNLMVLEGCRLAVLLAVSRKKKRTMRSKYITKLVELDRGEVVRDRTLAQVQHADGTNRLFHYMNLEGSTQSWLALRAHKGEERGAAAGPAAASRDYGVFFFKFPKRVRLLPLWAALRQPGAAPRTQTAFLL